MIYRIREVRVAVKCVEQEYPAIFVEGPGHPDCNANADHEIGEVAGCDIHLDLLFQIIFEHVQL
jgi:hypothetical protein